MFFFSKIDTINNVVNFTILI